MHVDKYGSNVNGGAPTTNSAKATSGVFNKFWLVLSTVFGSISNFFHYLSPWKSTAVTPVKINRVSSTDQVGRKSLYPTPQSTNTAKSWFKTTPKVDKVNPFMLAGAMDNVGKSVDKPLTWIDTIKENRVGLTAIAAAAAATVTIIYIASSFNRGDLPAQILEKAGETLINNGSAALGSLSDAAISTGQQLLGTCPVPVPVNGTAAIATNLPIVIPTLVQPAIIRTGKVLSDMSTALVPFSAAIQKIVADNSNSVVDAIQNLPFVGGSIAETTNILVNAPVNPTDVLHGVPFQGISANEVINTAGPVALGVGAVALIKKAVNLFWSSRQPVVVQIVVQNEEIENDPSSESLPKAGPELKTEEKKSSASDSSVSSSSKGKEKGLLKSNSSSSSSSSSSSGSDDVDDSNDVDVPVTRPLLAVNNANSRNSRVAHLIPVNKCGNLVRETLVHNNSIQTTNSSSTKPNVTIKEEKPVKEIEATSSYQVRHLKSPKNVSNIEEEDKLSQLMADLEEDLNASNDDISLSSSSSESSSEESTVKSLKSLKKPDKSFKPTSSKSSEDFDEIEFEEKMSKSRSEEEKPRLEDSLPKPISTVEEKATLVINPSNDERLLKVAQNQLEHGGLASLGTLYDSPNPFLGGFSSREVANKMAELQNQAVGPSQIHVQEEKKEENNVNTLPPFNPDWIKLPEPPLAGFGQKSDMSTEIEPSIPQEKKEEAIDEPMKKSTKPGPKFSPKPLNNSPSQRSNQTGNALNKKAVDSETTEVKEVAIDEPMKRNNKPGPKFSPKPLNNSPSQRSNQTGNVLNKKAVDSETTEVKEAANDAPMKKGTTPPPKRNSNIVISPMNSRMSSPVGNSSKPEKTVIPRSPSQTGGISLDEILEKKKDRNVDDIEKKIEEQKKQTAENSPSFIKTLSTKIVSLSPNKETPSLPIINDEDDLWNDNDDLIPNNNTNSNVNNTNSNVNNTNSNVNNTNSNVNNTTEPKTEVKEYKPTQEEILAHQKAMENNATFLANSLLNRRIAYEGKGDEDESDEW